MNVVNENGAKSKDKRLSDVNAVHISFMSSETCHISTFSFCSRGRTHAARAFIDFNWVTSEKLNDDVFLPDLLSPRPTPPTNRLPIKFIVI